MYTPSDLDPPSSKFGLNHPQTAGIRKRVPTGDRGAEPSYRMKTGPEGWWSERVYVPIWAVARFGAPSPFFYFEGCAVSAAEEPPRLAPKTAYTESNPYPYMRDLRVIQADSRTSGIVA